jgi:hypothetical protein
VDDVMNHPAIKFILKQMEDGAVIVEWVAKRKEIHTYDQQRDLDAAFNSLHSALSAVKRVVEELL